MASINALAIAFDLTSKRVLLTAVGQDFGRPNAIGFGDACMPVAATDTSSSAASFTTRQSIEIEGKSAKQRWPRK